MIWQGMAKHWLVKIDRLPQPALQHVMELGLVDWLAYIIVDPAWVKLGSSSLKLCAVKAIIGKWRVGVR